MIIEDVFGSIILSKRGLVDCSIIEEFEIMLVEVLRKWDEWFILYLI